MFFFVVEIVYENFYTTQSHQKTGLLLQHQRANHPKARVLLPPTPNVKPNQIVNNQVKSNGRLLEQVVLAILNKVY